jgi:hypothetical protein
MMRRRYAARLAARAKETQEHEEVRSRLDIGPSPFPRTDLERAVAVSLGKGEDIKRESAVRGDHTLAESIIEWAGDTNQRLEEAQAGALLAAFRAGGVQPPHGVAEHLGYLDRQIERLDSALRQLRSDEQPNGEATVRPAQAGFRGTLGFQMSPGPDSTSQPLLEFATEGQHARLIELGFEPTAIRFIEPAPERVVRASDLPVEITVGGGRLIVKQFTPRGFVVEESETKGDQVRVEGYHA